MSRPRYVVATVTGYPVHMPISRGSGSSSREGVSAHVCDTLYLYEVVASYRSADTIKGHGPGARLGVEGARAAAEAHAERLNRDTA